MPRSDYCAVVAAEVRAEMGRQNLTRRDLAQALAVTPATAGSRLDGSVPFDVRELAIVANWLGVTVTQLTPDHREPVSA